MPAWTPEDAAKFAEESKQRQEAEKAAAAKPPAKADKGSAPATDATPDKGAVAETTGSVAGGQDATKDKADPAPFDPAALDTSFLPDDVRSEVTFKSERAYAAIKSGHMAHSEATKRFQEAKALERDAQNYRNLVQDEEIAAVIVQAVADKKAGRKLAVPAAPVVEEKPDLLDPDALQAWLDKRDAKLREAVKAEIHSEINRPTALRAATNDALEAFAAENRVDPEVMLAAVKAADTHLAARGRKWDPDQVTTLMPGFVEAARLAKAVPSAPVRQVVPANGAAGLDSVASPVGRGGPHQTGTIPPPRYSNGLSTPPREMTSEDYEQQMLFTMRKRFGPDVTLEQVRASAAMR